MAYNSNESEEDDNSKSEEGNEGICLDVRVTVLIDLDEDYPSSDEHEGCVYNKQEQEMKGL